MTTCVILQPSYIPWRGYFDQIYQADNFMFYDDVPFDKNGWRNRNRIKTENGVIWLTVPVFKGARSLDTKNSEVRIKNNSHWKKKHLASIKYAYSRAPFFEMVYPFLEECFDAETDLLADFTIELNIRISQFLGIGNTNFSRSSAYSVSGRKTDRIINLLQEVGATHYLSGPSAKTYLENSKFEQAGISIEYLEYNYPEYPQLFPPFESHVSILDLLFMTGKEASRYIWAKDKNANLGRIEFES